jgi:hypothetical protein
MLRQRSFDAACTTYTRIDATYKQPSTFEPGDRVVMRGSSLTSADSLLAPEATRIWSVVTCDCHLCAAPDASLLAVDQELGGSGWRHIAVADLRHYRQPAVDEVTGSQADELMMSMVDGLRVRPRRARRENSSSANAAAATRFGAQLQAALTQLVQSIAIGEVCLDTEEDGARAYATVLSTLVLLIVELLAEDTGITQPMTAACPTWISLSALAEAKSTLRGPSDCPVCYRVLPPEVIGSIYESLMSFRVQLGSDGRAELQPTALQSRTGSFFTPRSLSAPLVARTLEPLFATMTPPEGEGPTSASILQLRICDPAMGVGAILIEVCRCLADALIDAWRREGTLSEHRDPQLDARRQIAQQCLRGVDKNEMAVKLSRITFWLFTFGDTDGEFLERNFRHGDALVGLSAEQLRSFHWKSRAGFDAAVTAPEPD